MSAGRTAAFVVRFECYDTASMTGLDDLQLIAEREIDNAFPVGTPPSEETLCEGQNLDAQETARRFKGKPWPEISVSDLTRNPELGWLRPAAFHYYLPALMLRSMQDRVAVDCVLDGVLGELSPPQAKLSGRFIERLGLFTPHQARAILAFLRFIEARERADWSQADWPSEAVASVPLAKNLARAIRYWSGRMVDTP